jgi:hypothetical protein
MCRNRWNVISKLLGGIYGHTVNMEEYKGILLIWEEHMSIWTGWEEL